MTTEDKKLSGPQLFIRYVFVCGDAKVKEGKITPEELKELGKIIKMGREPDTAFLEKLFPKPAEDMRNFSRSIGVPMWTMETVSRYFRNYHDHPAEEGGRDVFLVKVIGISPKPRILTIEMEKSWRIFPETLYAVNIYGLDLQVKDMVYIHKFMVVEKV